jgi:BirA family transcriptional regulator, biotin operon repressor / biotin---[acetyl-CoA-carboxylase] ligase
MPLSESAVSAALAPRPLRFYPQIGSTNDAAMEWLSQGAKHGSVVIADEQVKGRGRLGRSWHTPPGTALIVSVILLPNTAHLPQLTMLGALAICDMLDHLGVPWVSIKWPNDVQVNGKKVSGVLPEVHWEGTRLAGVVLGIGINVRTDFSTTDLAHSAISIEPVLGRPVQRLDLLKDLLARIDYWFARLGTDALFENWQCRLITLGQSVQAESQGHLVTGVAQSVDSSGALMVTDGEGRLHRILAGDVGLGSTG